MDNRKALVKHYVKRAINTIRYPNNKNNCLVIKDWRVQENSLFITYVLGGESYENRIEFFNVPNDFFQKEDNESLAVLAAHIGFTWSHVFFKIDYIHEIRCDFLNFHSTWTDFHEYLIKNRLGEFRFLQGLNFDAPVKVTGNSSMLPFSKLKFRETSDVSLVLNGGGKDSTTTMEILKDAGVEARWFTVGLNSVRKAVVDQSGVDVGIHLRYFPDNKIRTNAKFSYTPITGPSFYSSVAFATAYILGYKNIILSNEFSANEPNIIVNGVEINHQFTKTFEFERRYNNFLSEISSGSVLYFSFLRPLYELSIVREFSKLLEYYDKFVSCNIGIGKGKWCCDCEKCAFTCLCLSAFVETEKVSMIFKEDLLQKSKIRKLIIKLCSDETKAWECVGVRAECQLALRLLLNLNPDLDFEFFPKRVDLENACADINVEDYTRIYLNSFNSPHLLPDSFVRILKERLSIFP